MLRSLSPLVLVVLILSSATASFERKLPHGLGKEIPLASVRSLTTAAANDEYRISPATEVLLDGRPCPYSAIPNTATIILLETMTNESKEIARIHFRTGSRPASAASPSKQN
jgi:hypothetical protein